MAKKVSKFFVPFSGWICVRNMHMISKQCSFHANTRTCD